MAQHRLHLVGLFCGLSLAACDYVPPPEITLPPPQDFSYQTVSMLSTVGQTPRMQAEKGRTRIDFGEGSGSLTIRLDGAAVKQKFGVQALADCRTTACLEADPEYQQLLKSRALSEFKLATGTLEVGATKLDLKLTAYSLGADLSYAIELIGLAANTRIRVTGAAYDRNGKVLGTLAYNQVIDEKPDVVTLERMLGEIQTAVGQP